jgi:hypothetical protein
MSSAVKSKKRGRPTEGPSIAAEIELALSRKKALDTELLNLERQIFALETSYLENTALLGDLIRGWNDFTNPSSPGGPGGSTMIKKKKKIHDHERIFSSSSVSAQKNPEFHSYASTTHSMASSAVGHRPHVASSSAMDEDNLEDYGALSLDLEMDTPARRKVSKNTTTDSNTKKRGNAAGSRSTPKPTKQLSTSLSLAGESDSLGSFPATDDLFEQH